MVSLKIQLLATILLISQAYCQNSVCGAYPQPQRTASPPCIIPGGQFIVPAVIKPLVPTCQPAQPAPKKQESSCPDDDDDSQLDKLLYLLISNIIESKKGSGKKQSSSCESAAYSCDPYDACACSYGDDYDYCSYPAPVVCSSGGGDGCCPEISVYIRPVADCN